MCCLFDKFNDTKFIYNVWVKFHNKSVSFEFIVIVLHRNINSLYFFLFATEREWTIFAWMVTYFDSRLMATPVQLKKSPILLPNYNCFGALGNLTKSPMIKVWKIRQKWKIQNYLAYLFTYIKSVFQIDSKSNDSILWSYS